MIELLIPPIFIISSSNSSWCWKSIPQFNWRSKNVQIHRNTSKTLIFTFSKYFRIFQNILKYFRIFQNISKKSEYSEFQEERFQEQQQEHEQEQEQQKQQQPISLLLSPTALSFSPSLFFSPFFLRFIFHKYEVGTWAGGLIRRRWNFTIEKPVEP